MSTKYCCSQKEKTRCGLEFREGHGHGLGHGQFTKIKKKNVIIRSSAARHRQAGKAGKAQHVSFSPRKLQFSTAQLERENLSDDSTMNTVIL